MSGITVSGITVFASAAASRPSSESTSIYPVAGVVDISKRVRDRFGVVPTVSLARRFFDAVTSSGVCSSKDLGNFLAVIDFVDCNNSDPYSAGSTAKIESPTENHILVALSTPQTTDANS
jgi:hypothetical protein